MKKARFYLVWIVTFIVQVGMVSNTRRVRTFTLFRQKYTWNEAQYVCDQFGQNMLTVKNPEEVTVFQIIAEKWKTDGYLTGDMWTGLYDREQDDASVAQYRWQGDCSPLGSSPLWYNNEPNHQDVDFCVRLDKDDFQIRTTKCNIVSCVVCQKEEDECPFETLEDRLITETHVNVSSQDVASCQQLCRTTDAGDTECAACDYTPSLSLCRMAMRSTLYIGEEQPATSASASSTVHIKRCFIGIYNPATPNIVANNDTKANGRCNASTTTSTVTPSASSTTTTTAYSINTSNAAVTTDTDTTTVAASTATTFPSITTATATTVAATATTAAATTTATTTTTTTTTTASTSTITAAAASTDTTYLATTTSASGPTVALTNSTAAATASTGIGIVTTSADTFSAAVTTPPTAISTTTTTTTTATATAAADTTTAAAASSATADLTVIPSVNTPTIPEPTNHDSSTTVLTTNTTLGLVNGLHICNSSVRGAVCICRKRETLFDWKEEQKLLHLKKKLLSSYRRSKTSVADDRPSAISIGTIGTTVIISVVLAVASTDFYRCCVGLFQLKRAIFK